jgi:Uma2 family endonuclease
MQSMQERIDDYLNFGVSFVWVIDPQNRRGWIYTLDGAREARDGFLRTANPDLAVPLAELFDND